MGFRRKELCMPKKIEQTITVISFNILIYVLRNEAWILLGWGQENKETERYRLNQSNQEKVLLDTMKISMV